MTRARAVAVRRGPRRSPARLHSEAAGGIVLVAAAAAGLVLVNSPWRNGYLALREVTAGPSWLTLDLAAWSAEGLLALFFFVVGLELKQELVVGELRHPRRAMLPVAAAAGGVVVPAALYTAVVVAAEADALRGWAVPTATDIVFALAVLSVAGRHLPRTLRTFLLTLAVVDDLVAVAVIAVFYTDRLWLVPLASSLLAVAAFAAVVHRRAHWWPVLTGLAVAAWALMELSGVHPTVAGVLLGLSVPATSTDGLRHSVAARWEHRWRPVSAFVAVPLFAFFAVGIELGAPRAVLDALTGATAVAILAGLVVGKGTGVLLATWLVVRLGGAPLPRGAGWPDMTGVAMLTGTGFTVSLLIGDVAFGAGSAGQHHVALAVLVGSSMSAALGALILRLGALRGRGDPQTVRAVAPTQEHEERPAHHRSSQ